jgi:hypothetical protein
MIDLEGIGNDGFGYTVKISAGSGNGDDVPVRKGLRARVRRDLGIDSETFEQPRQWFVGGQIFTGSETMQPTSSDPQRPSIGDTHGICERRSVEVQESFREVPESEKKGDWNIGKPKW